MFQQTLIELGLLIVAAKLAEGVLGRLGLNSIVAFTFAGVLLGPVAGIVKPTAEPELFLSLGVFVLLFLIGLDEIDTAGILATIHGRYVAVALGSVLISILVAMLVTSDLLGFPFALGLDFNYALALAGILSLSSLGIAAKVLSDSGYLRKPIGIEIFTLVIIAEIAALLVVGFTIGTQEHEFDLLGTVRLLVQIVAFLAAAWFLSARALPPAIVYLQRIINVPQLSFGLMIGGLLLVVAGTEFVGLHGSIGALLFGASLTGLPDRVRREILPGLRSAADGLFVPLFFAAAGLRFDLSFTTLAIGTIVALVLVPLFGKFVGTYIFAVAMRLQNPLTLSTALMAKGVTEIALLVVLFESGAIDQPVFSLLVLIMLGYILLMPQLISFAVRHVTSRHRPSSSDAISRPYIRMALTGVSISSVLDRTQTYFGPSASVAQLLGAATAPHQSDFLVVDDGQVCGIVTLDRLHAVPVEKRAQTHLDRLIRRDIPRAQPEELVSDVLERMDEQSVGIIPVCDHENDKLLGSIASHDLLDLVLLIGEVNEEIAARENAAG